MNDDTLPKDENQSGEVVVLNKKKAAIEAKQSSLSKHLQKIRASSSAEISN